MTNPQTEARAIVTAALPPHEQAILGHDAVTVLTDLIATALAAKDAELAAVKENCETVCNSYADENQRLYDRAERAEAQLAEANRKIAEKDKALEPFANAYGLDGSQRDKDPISGYWADVENEGPNAVTFGHFRAARRAREAQGGENNG